MQLILWPCGPMDKASDYESGDSRFESWQGRNFSVHNSEFVPVDVKIGFNPDSNLHKPGFKNRNHV